MITLPNQWGTEMNLQTYAGQQKMLAELTIRRSFKLLEGYISLLKDHGTLDDAVVDGQIQELRTGLETVGLIAPRFNISNPADLVEAERWEQP